MNSGNEQSNGNSNCDRCDLEARIEYYKSIHQHRYHLADRFFNLLAQEAVGVILITGWLILNSDNLEGRFLIVVVLLMPILVLLWLYNGVMEKCFMQSAVLCEVLRRYEKNELSEIDAQEYGIKTNILDKDLSIFGNKKAGRRMAVFNYCFILLFAVLVILISGYDFFQTFFRG